MLTKQDIKLSGVYGKKIIDSIDIPLICKKENSWQYKKGKLNFFYYPKSKKIYISGDNSEEIYEQILEKLNTYLENLAALPEETYLKEFMQEKIENNISLTSDYHIFNIEILASLIKSKYERLTYADEFTKSIRYMTLPFYEELMLYLMYGVDQNQVEELCTSIIEEYSEVKRIDLWDSHYEKISENEKLLIKKNLEKMKVEEK